MAEYKCVKGFSVQTYDDDGFNTEEMLNIEEGSIWLTPYEENYRLIGGEVRLESDDGWIEVPKEDIEAFFERIR